MNKFVDIPLDAGHPLVKPKGTRAYHHGRIRPDMDFWILFKGLGFHTPGAGGRLPPHNSDFALTTA